jgi:hypothetical protein
MRYVERKFSLRVRKTDGTAKLLVGLTSAGGFYIGKLLEIPVGKNNVLRAMITAQPKGVR